ncbi:hypothetical protein CENSYa_0393 [Cenarchaeum symbiosum A]|uniref:Uncharacterized protein n=1 Tax=Cenarchaeum symbiosum (strain A) TaxID=414004 RepID=A0RUL2_CENSY|nr:hypothetical protein CENSYa_0393 [Cenarchaeum symbiosum A]
MRLHARRFITSIAAACSVPGFRITKMDIQQSYFFGRVETGGEEYKLNIQSERRGKVLRMPPGMRPSKERLVVRLTGPGGIYVEDYLPYKGESEWLEIDSDEIAYFLADHQDQLDTIEVMDE